ncbi:MAG: hypothetical protein M0P69_06030 [Bacteroidales bacterium]|nr:hypothetical protein [Bacteroidales bacterium]
MKEEHCECHGKILEKLKRLEADVGHQESMWEAIKGKVCMSTFKWIVGILFALTITLYGQIIYSQRTIQDGITKSTVDIAVMAKALEQIEKGMK